MGEGTFKSIETEYKLWNKNNAFQQIREMEGLDVPALAAKGASPPARPSSRAATIDPNLSNCG
jgi:hypothetical protein